MHGRWRAFDTPNNDGYVLQVRDGGFADSPLIGRYCGQVLPPTARSSGKELYVLFKSDSSIAHAGFDARYRIGLFVY